MIYFIAAPITRNTDGDLVVGNHSTRRADSCDGLTEFMASEDGEVVGLWEMNSEDNRWIPTQETREWIETTLPDSIYMKSSWEEMILAAPHYREQMACMKAKG